MGEPDSGPHFGVRCKKADDTLKHSREARKKKEIGCLSLNPEKSREGSQSSSGSSSPSHSDSGASPGIDARKSQVLEIINSESDSRRFSVGTGNSVIANAPGPTEVLPPSL